MPTSSGRSAASSSTPTLVCSAVQRASIIALETPTQLLEQQRSVYRRRRDRMVSVLNRIGLGVEPPLGTFYLWVPLPEGVSSMEFFDRLLREAAVVAIPGIGFGHHGEGFVRFSLTVPDHRLDEAVERIEVAGERLMR